MKSLFYGSFAVSCVYTYANRGGIVAYNRPVMQACDSLVKEDNLEVGEAVLIVTANGTAKPF